MTYNKPVIVERVGGAALTIYPTISAWSGFWATGALIGVKIAVAAEMGAGFGAGFRSFVGLELQVATGTNVVALHEALKGAKS